MTTSFAVDEHRTMNEIRLATGSVAWPGSQMGAALWGLSLGEKELTCTHDPFHTSTVKTVTTNRVMKA